ncbi:hypothetical protein J7J18_04880 [bacterium]|nr:hypothetical protein [bacterium]
MIRQLYYLRRSGIIRLSIKTERKIKTEAKTETKPETKTETKPKKESKKWKEFKERFKWVNELLDKTER